MKWLHDDGSDTLMHLLKHLCIVFDVKVAKNLACLRVDVGHILAESCEF